MPAAKGKCNDDCNVKSVGKNDWADLNGERAGQSTATAKCFVKSSGGEIEGAKFLMIATRIAVAVAKAPAVAVDVSGSFAVQIRPIVLPNAFDVAVAVAVLATVCGHRRPLGFRLTRPRFGD